MGRPSGAELAAIRAIEDALASVPAEEDGSLVDAVGALRELTGVRAVALHILHAKGEGLSVERFAGAGVPASFRSAFNAYLADKVIGWTAYNPLWPDPSQRNIVMGEQELYPLCGGKPAIEREFYPRVGMAGFSTLRVLLCEGPQLVGYLGLFDPGAADARTRRVLRRLAPAFRARLGAEHALRFGSRMGHALDAVLEEIGSAALVVERGGRILVANRAARERLESTPRAMRADLARSFDAKDAQAPFRVIPIHSVGMPPTFVAIARIAEDDAASRVQKNARALRLTPRQLDVATLIARGMSNREIAIRLKIAERTVETHVTAILEIAGAASRSALVVRLLR